MTRLVSLKTCEKTYSDVADPDECSSDDERSSGALWGMLRLVDIERGGGGCILRRSRDDEVPVNDLHKQRHTTTDRHGS